MRLDLSYQYLSELNGKVNVIVSGEYDASAQSFDPDSYAIQCGNTLIDVTGMFFTLDLDHDKIGKHEMQRKAQQAYEDECNEFKLARAGI